MERPILRAAVFCAGCLWFAMQASAEADEPFSIESVPGRLPKTVVPLSYDIAVTPNIEALTLQGTESVVLQVRTATDSVEFNSVNERLSDVRLDGQPVKSVQSNDEKEWTTVTLAKPASPGQHVLTFSYAGKIETRPRGLFAQHYTLSSGGKQGVLLSTQFEAVDARRMFPCWDEPAFRATFQLSVTVRSDWATMSNMPIAKREPHGNLTTTTFQRTPKMPSYLVEFTAGDMVRIEAKNSGVDFGVWAVRGREQYGKQALADAQPVLADYNEYFGYPYPLPKLDSIAIPGGFSGAMENWGAIVYNEQTLLILPSSTIADQQEVFSIQAHEMAHQWNGDLVTMAWWDDLWLNESFASWMAAKETERRHPEWHWWERQDAAKESAMRADARVGSHAIQQHVTDELQANNAFDPAITYDKGQSILRMLEAYIGPDTFRSGVRSYIKARAFSNATTADLWKGLNAASGKDISRITGDWTAQAGFPLVSAQAACDAGGKRTVKLSQARFLLQGTDQNRAHWSVPLQVRTGAKAAPQPVLLTSDNQTVAAGRCDEPLSLNADAIGFYRVRYDSSTLAANTRGFAQLPSGDRIALLDDQWALVGSGKEPLAAYLALASSMGSNLDVRAWQQVESALSTMEFDERGTPGYNAFTSYARSLLKPAFERLGWDAKPGETADVAQLRRPVLEDLGEWGDAAVIAEARKRLDAFLQTHSGLSPDGLLTVVNIVARTADAATFEKLHTLAKSAKDETELRMYYSALMLVHDEALAQKAAQIAVSKEIPPQTESERVHYVFTLARQHQQLGWKIFTDHSREILRSHSPFDAYVIAQYVPEVFWSGVPLDQLDSWIHAHVPAEMNGLVQRGMEGARYKLAEKKILLAASDAWKGKAAAAIPASRPVVARAHWDAARREATSR
jgi:aminopeptidase N